MVKNVLVAIDGSPTSQRALEYALAMGKNYHANVIVFHAAVPLDYSQLPKETEATKVDAQVPAIGKDVYSINKTLSPLSNAKSIVASFGYENVSYREVITDSAYKAILEAATAMDVDNIIIGNRGIGGIKGLLMGSIANKIVEYAPCTVTIVK